MYHQSSLSFGFISKFQVSINKPIFINRFLKKIMLVSPEWTRGCYLAKTYVTPMGIFSVKRIISLQESETMEQWQYAILGFIIKWLCPILAKKNNSNYLWRSPQGFATCLVIQTIFFFIFKIFKTPLGGPLLVQERKLKKSL